jgi:hypothetical protein
VTAPLDPAALARRALPRGVPTIVAAMLLALAAPSPARAAPARPGAAPGAASRLGIRVTALRLTAAGYMVDVRYRVTDPARAKAFLGRRSGELFLVDEASGARLAVPTTPKLGALRQRAAGEVRTDRDYFVLFANPGRQLRPGAKVTLVAGGARVPHLAVE